MMDFAPHKHKRMITDPKVNDTWIFNFLWEVGDTYKSVSLLKTGVTRVGSVINWLRP